MLAATLDYRDLNLGSRAEDPSLVSSTDSMAVLRRNRSHWLEASLY